MKNMKRILTLGLALALSFSLATPAFAKDDNGDGYDDVTGEYIGGQTITDSPDVEVGTEFTYKNEEGKTVPFIGIIKPTQIKATIPTQVVFDLDPTLNVVDDWNTIKGDDPTKTDINYAQVTNPTNLKIVNNSTIPMYVYITDVKAVGATLTNVQADLTKDKNIMFAITSTPEGTVDTITDGDHWMIPTSATDSKVVINTDRHYVLNPLKGTPPPIATPQKETRYVGVAPANTTDNTDELPLWVNAISITGWNSDDVFTVLPTIIVAAKDPDVKPDHIANTVNPGVNPGPNVGDNYAQDPVADVAPGLVLANAPVTLSSTGATKIFYTTDGTTAPTYTYDASGAGTWTPGANTTEYNAAITIDVTKTIKAIAATVGKKDSAVVTFAYTVTTQVAAPDIDVTNPAAVTITSTDGGAAIYYTLDGTTPTTASTLYTGTFNLSGATDPVIIKAIAIEADKIDSEVVTETYNAPVSP